MKKLSKVLVIITGVLFYFVLLSAQKQPLDADALLSKMSLRDKIGQMILIDKVYLQDEADLTNYSIGGLFCGGDSFPDDLRAHAWASMADHYQKIAKGSALGIPILFGIDSVHGLAKVADATIFPHNIGMGCTGNPALVEKAARITAMEMKATGMNWNFAPCVAVSLDERWGRTYESFSEDTALVTRMAAAFVLGSERTGIITSTKHFIGDGGTEAGKNEGNATGNDNHLRKTFLPPYLAAISNGTKTIMISFSSWNGTLMHGNKRLVAGLLKSELKYGGIVVSDWGAVGRLPGTYTEQLVTAVNAGIDMVMLPRDYKKFMENMIVLVESGAISKARIDDAVRRILKVKIDAGLFKSYLADSKLLKTVGSPANRAVARQCVRESVVLLKNTNSFLPLSKKIKKLIVAGRSADNMDNQCGGWTIYWQGNSGRVLNGTTVLKAIQKCVSPTTKVIHYQGGDEPIEKADAAVFVTGEYPYTETAGDRAELSLDQDELEQLNNILDKGIPVVVVLISGRPMIITKELPKWNAFLAAWLPGPEGEGIADVLFGSYNPTGKLSMSWPADMSQVPINVGDKNYKPLFEFGYGLGFKSKK